MEEKFIPHKLKWDYVKIGRFWDFYSANNKRAETYFSYQFGDALLDLVAKKVGTAGDVLDYGCGRGYLMQKLLKRGSKVSGLDFSQQSIEHVKETLSNEEKFDKALFTTALPSNLKNESFDFVYSLEMVEHLLEKDIEPTLQEMNRVLKTGGHLVVTVPNEENLESHNVICPECGCSFHRMQHISSFSAESLSGIMSKYGFEKVYCQGTLLMRDTLINRIKKIIRGDKYDKPHLIYIGKKI